MATPRSGGNRLTGPAPSRNLPEPNPESRRRRRRYRPGTPRLVIHRRVGPLRLTIPTPLRPRTEPPSAGAHARWFLKAFGILVGLGAILLALPWTSTGTRAAPVDALFTAVSAACTTGLVTVDTRQQWNWFGEVVLLVLMQMGGLGFMVGASIILQMLRRGTGLRETLLLRDGEPALTVAEVRSLAGRILRFTLVTEGIGAILLAVRFWLGHDLSLPRALWHGVFYSVSAFCNASFDLTGGFQSLQPFKADIWVNGVIAGLIQAGALSYLVLHEVVERRRWARFSLDAKLVLLGHALLVVGGALVFLVLEWGDSLADRPGWSRPMTAVFVSVAARSGGFTTVDLAQATSATLFIFVAVMLVGGASGSCAGGVRLTTVGVVVAAIVATLRGQEYPQVFRRRISTELVFRAMAVIALFGVAFGVATTLLALSEEVFGAGEQDFIALMFEAGSALATDGLSTGITPGLSEAGKLVLIGTMFLGRVGPLTAAYALQRRAGTVRYRYPEAPVRIG